MKVRNISPDLGNADKAIERRADFRLIRGGHYDPVDVKEAEAQERREVRRRFRILGNDHRHDNTDDAFPLRQSA